MNISYQYQKLLLAGIFIMQAEGKLKGSVDQNNRKLELLEWQECVPFDDPLVQQATGAVDNPWGTYSEECDTNECPGGCCRFHTHVLRCDEDNDFPHQPCVCNDNTAAPEENKDVEGVGSITGIPGIDDPPSSAPSTITTSPPSSTPSTITTSPPSSSCLQVHASCDENSDCCSGICHQTYLHSVTKICRASPKNGKVRLSMLDRTESGRGGAAGRVNEGGSVGGVVSIGRTGNGVRRERRVKGY